MSTGRRRFLKGAAIAALAGAAGPGPVAVAAGRRVGHIAEERRRAVVVGTGFGGAITALRLARAGVDVLLLERGIRWPVRPGADVFPRMFHQDRRASWLTPGARLHRFPAGRVAAVHRCHGTGAGNRHGRDVRCRSRRRLTRLSRHDRSADRGRVHGVHAGGPGLRGLRCRLLPAGGNGPASRADPRRRAGP